ncbi:hypothetical protein [Paucibacter sp. Y2R2-4]|uniref:hypothetical protein n=1 Tax=Paucibacter sp. Y2R2-4 TaxID=2893553 RepID=UPI0021E3EF05|nr:hypothetical protein [Paucibacter sp. Y2R2-4]MCV2351799.1 hypothetical protein [Paucibacter sp. Y2R2-4]
MSPAQAELRLVHSRTEFSAATSTQVSDNFDDIVWAQGLSSLNRALCAGFTYAVTALRPDGSDTSTLCNAGSKKEAWLSTDNANDVLSFYFGSSQEVYGVGGNFFGTDALGYFQPGQKIQLSVRDESGLEQTIVVESAGIDSFYGFVSNKKIQYFEIRAIQQGEDMTWATANNLVLGAISAAPEPESEPDMTYSMLAGIAFEGWRQARHFFKPERKEDELAQA